MLGGGGGGRHISGFNKNAKILYFVTKLLQGRQIAHKSVTDFPEICMDFHAEGRGPNAFGVLLGSKLVVELETMTWPSSGPWASLCPSYKRGRADPTSSREAIALLGLRSSRVLFSHSVVSNSVTPWTVARQASPSFTISQGLLKLLSIDLVMPSNHLILCHTFLLLPSIFPSIQVFPMNQLFASGGQSIGASASASVLSVNIQGESLPNPLESVTTATTQFSSFIRGEACFPVWDVIF